MSYMTNEKLERADAEIARLENIVKIQAKQIERLIDERDAIKSSKIDMIGRSEPQNWGPSDPYFGLSVRARNCCIAFRLLNRQQIAAAISNGSLDYRKVRCRNYGKKTDLEVRAWLLSTLTLTEPTPQTGSDSHLQSSARSRLD